MHRPLITPAWRRPAITAAVLGVAVFLSLAVLVFHASRTGFDAWAFRVLPEHISDTHAQFLIGFTEPALSVVVLALTVVLALALRRVDLAVLAVLGPALGTVLASDVAKPLIHRSLFASTAGSFPSGHETGVACTATVLLIAFGQLPLQRAARYVLAAVLGVWVVVAAVGLTRFYYHWATDTIGAIGLSVSFVLGLSLLLDRWWPHRTTGARRAGPVEGSDVAPDVAPADALNDADDQAPPAARPRPRPSPGRPEPQLTPRA